jgi:GR25 family glycosyltransferase involved in LPS biosynthesis
MKTYLISLPHRKDRVEQFKPLAYLTNHTELEIFEATNGQEMFTFESNKRMKGHFGCWDSHRRLLEKIKDEGNNMTLVCEDDCEFISEEVAEYLDQLPEDWDLLYLGGVNQDIPEQFSEKLEYAKNILQTHAYIVRDKFVPTLLETLTNHRWKVDIVFSEAIKRGKCFICNPPIAIQRESFSDITHR